jgi:hypothetical protein
MKCFNKIVALAAFVAMMAASSHQLSAQEYVTDTGGCGYQECRRVPSLAPAIALGTIAIIAIVAVAVQNSNHHGHGHSHG